jgi:hypothetical protein
MKRGILIFVTILIFSGLVYAAVGPRSTVQTTTIETTLIIESPPITTSTPTTIMQFKCSTLGTLQERIRCRIGLKEENELNYLPEECKPLLGRKRVDCIKLYSATNKCFDIKDEDGKLNCARSAVNITDVRQEAANCKIKLGNEKDACMNNLKAKAYGLIKFRFYNLEYRAQQLKDKGVSEDLIVKFISDLELKKQSFNDAKSSAERKQMILDARQLWKDFLVNAGVKK